MSTCAHTARLAFRKATASGGNENGPNCVEVAPFRKALDSNPSGNCVEVGHASARDSNGNGGNNCVEPGQAHADPHADPHAACTPETCLTPGISPGDVVVRDSKLGEDSPLVVFRADEWRGYVAAVINGGMEHDGTEYVLRDLRNPGIILHFTPGEAEAFRSGCTKGEFNYAQDRVAASA